MNPLIFEYLVNDGQLTGAIGNTFDYVRLRDDGGGVKIVEWDFPEPQPTPSQLIAVEQSQGFENYLNNRESIVKKAQSKLKYIEQLNLAEMKVILDEVNVLRKFNRDMLAAVAASTSLADLKTRFAQLNGMADRTGAQFKTAVENEIDNQI